MKVPYIDLARAHQPLKAALLEAFERTIDHGGFCLGPEVASFEENFSKLIETRRCVAVGSGTEALHLIAQAWGIGPGDEVIVPAYSFIASAWFAEYVGAKIVFADIDLTSFTIDPEAIAKQVTSRTKAIVVTHLYGQAAEMTPILQLAEARGIKVVEDAAQAHLARCNGKMVGSIGDAGAFSFYPTKNLGALGEGGAVVSPDEGLLYHIAVLRAHGAETRYLNEHIGYNNRMEGLQAASLNVKLPFLVENTKRRQAVARRYLEGIDNPDLMLPKRMDWGESVYHVFTVLHPERDAFRERLLARGVQTDIVYPISLHRQPCFQYLGYEKGDFVQAECAAAQCVSLPMFPELRDDEIDYVIESLNAG